MLDLASDCGQRFLANKTLLLNRDFGGYEAGVTNNTSTKILGVILNSKVRVRKNVGKFLRPNLNACMRHVAQRSIMTCP